MTRRRWLPLLLLAGAAGVAFAVAWRGHVARPPDAAELDAADPGWRVADRLAARPPVPDDQNAVLVVQAAYALIPRGTDTPLARAITADPWLASLDAANAQQADPRVVAWWRASAAVIAAGRRAKDLPRGDSKIVVMPDPFATCFPRLGEANDVGEHLHLDAVWSARHGDPGGAADSVRALLNIGRVFAAEPFSLNYICGVSNTVRAADGLVRVLAAAELPDATLADIQAELAAALKPTLPAALRDLRAWSDAGCDAVADGRAGLRFFALGSDFRTAADEFAYTSWRLRTDQAELRDRLTGFVALAGRPAHEWTPGLAAVPPPLADWEHLVQFAQDRQARRLFAAALRQQAMLRATLAAVGCERFRVRHGRWPASLADLPADLRLPDGSDPYTGRPLRCACRPDGLTVWGVGPDGADHGGDLRPFPGHPPRQDVGARLWDVATRNKPAEVAR